MTVWFLGKERAPSFLPFTLYIYFYLILYLMLIIIEYRNLTKDTVICLIDFDNVRVFKLCLSHS
jgi:hypothetical protein